MGTKKKAKEKRYRRAVVLESPYASDTPVGLTRNILYAKRAMRDSLNRGEAPFASHLLYTIESILDEELPADRAKGLDCCHAWIRKSNGLVVYQDLGISPGMEQAIALARRLGLTIEYRNIL